MKRKCLAVGIILLFVCGALMPACSAQINTPQANEVTTSSESSVKKVKHTNNDNESFFAFAFIRGTYEIKWGGGFFIGINVFNQGPWYNRTINVIAYVEHEHKFIFKKSCDVDCRYWIGIAVLHHACGIGYDVSAF